MPSGIRPGQCFYAQFATRDLVVRIDDHVPGGGWVARSLTHGRKVFIKSIDQILYRCDEEGLQMVADVTIPPRHPPSGSTGQGCPADLAPNIVPPTNRPSPAP